MSSVLRCFLIFCAAAGNQGGEMLFQATSEEMIRAYSKVPRYVRLFDAYMAIDRV